MQATHFDKTLKTFRHRKPFRPFSVQFLSGEVVDVDHPEAVVVRAGVGVYVAPDGTPTLFDHESGSEVVAASGRGKAQVPGAWGLVPGAKTSEPTHCSHVSVFLTGMYPGVH